MKLRALRSFRCPVARCLREVDGVTWDRNWSSHSTKIRSFGLDRGGDAPLGMTKLPPNGPQHVRTICDRSVGMCSPSVTSSPPESHAGRGIFAKVEHGRRDVVRHLRTAAIGQAALLV